MIPVDILIEKINKLQDICSHHDLKSLDLPQVVVLGSQSCGKTSVLENIVGQDILPRGCGIVTRRPLVLQLINSNLKDHAVFNHLPNKIFTDPGEVKKEIVDETNRLLRSKNDISSIPITLKLYSQRFLTLTLVDLPGLVRIPTSDQPKNIADKIAEVCRGFASNKNAIILAVSAANSDIANSDALQLAKELDPLFERTMGVLTKVDCLEDGTDVVDILAGKIVSLKHGFVPVANRSQRDIDRGKDIASALADEKRFFSEHPSYRKNHLFCGTSYLALKLHSILHEHIKAVLPELQEKISSRLSESRQKLSELGLVYLNPKENVLKTINDISRRFSETLSGDVGRKNLEVTGGARIAYVLNNHFPSFVEGLDPLHSISDDLVKATLYNCKGVSSVGLFSERAFENLVKISISDVKPHAIKLVNIVFAEAVKIVNLITESSSFRFPALNEKIRESMIGLLKSRAEETQKLITSFMEWNVNHISTHHPDFVKWDELFRDSTKQKIDFYQINEKTSILDSLPGILKIRRVSSKETKEVAMLKEMVVSYFNIFRRIAVDQIPKAIMYEMVEKAEKTLQETLFRDIYERTDLEDIVSESEQAQDQRRALLSSIDALKQAYELICSL